MGKLIFEHETLAKTVTYCIMHFTVAILVAYGISRDWGIALSIGVVEPLVQTWFFSMHERKWNSARAKHRQRYMDSGLASTGM